MRKIILVTLLLLITSILYPLKISDNEIIFEHQDNNATSVYLVGSMNDWDTTATPMNKDDDGIWRVSLNLNYGDYVYKFMADGNWAIDEYNSSYEDDGYGGSNSVISFYGKNSLQSDKKNKKKLIQSSFNPKVYFKGQYFSENSFQANNSNKYMLDKPEHDLNFGIQVKFNSDFEAYTLFNVNNVKEGTDMWKTHFNYKRSMFKLNADYIDIIAFDNMGIFSFDSPLNIIGDIGYNNYDFGFNYSGVSAQTSTLFTNELSSIIPIEIYGKVLLADKVGYTEDDVSASRIKFSKSFSKNNKVIFGLSHYKYTANLSDQFYQEHDNFSYDIRFYKQIQKSNWKDSMIFSLSSEYSEYENSDITSSTDIWMSGYNFYLGSSLKFPASLKIYGNYIHSSFDISGSSSVDKINIGVNYSSDRFSWDVGLNSWQNNISDSLGWVDYYKYFEKSGGNGRWYQEYSETSFQKYTLLGYDKGVLLNSKISYTFNLFKKSLKTVLINTFAKQNLLTNPKYIENIFIIEYKLSDIWMLKYDLRIPYYNDSFLGLETDFSDDKDVFIDKYFELSYNISSDIWISFGYGINPFSMDNLTDKFHYKGREEYLDSVGGLPSHLDLYYGGLGAKIRQAEDSLMNNKMILMRAIIKF